MRIFLIGCAFLLLIVGCAGTSSETSKKEQGSSPQATQSEEEARCEGTRTIKVTWLHQWPDAGPTEHSAVFTTNDLPGCPKDKGGLLPGTDKRDKLNGLDGDDEIRGLAGPDFIFGGAGNDIIHAGPGDDEGKGKFVERNVMGNRGDDVLYGGDGNDTLGSEMGQDVGEDVYHGGDGNDVLGGIGNEGEDVYYGEDGNDGIFAYGDRQPDKLYCGKGKDRYIAEKIDYVVSSCEKKLFAPIA